MRSTCLALALSLLGTACAADSDDGDHVDNVFQTVPDAGEPYRVVVAFGSYGAGIDSDAYGDIVAYVGAYDLDVSPYTFQRGLEGETNLCFTLHGLNTQAQALFVDDVEAIAQRGYLTNVYENVTCNLIPN